MPWGGSSEVDEEPSASAVPCHLLELTVISAQDLFPATARSMRAYATAWVHPDRKLLTRTDRAGRTDPTWNDKLVFRVDAAFLLSVTSAVTVDIFAARRRLSPRLRDPHLGTVRVLLSAFRPEPGSRRFAALQVRRPNSLRPQGILNVGIALLDGLAYVDRMVPLHDDIGEPYAFAYKDLEALSMERRAGEESSPRRSAASMFVGGGGAEEWMVEKSGSVESWIGEKEQEALESKLELWKSELSPDYYDIGDRSLGGRRKRRRKGTGGFRSLSCFCGGTTKWA
ncbi:uncharacterized protein LOC103711856 [Phoenix dactylifera]|uniref:Uncharacterized protein LOC103711856 n=1 Tax=Phoenix dactylifera TaxID=42345 RepID=A0A8B7CCK5_PHODC|nr:uncharacterized protein LOC103711856 [Phoenix dactylifera]